MKGMISLNAWKRLPSAESRALIQALSLLPIIDPKLRQLVCRRSLQSQRLLTSGLWVSHCSAFSSARLLLTHRTHTNSYRSSQIRITPYLILWGPINYRLMKEEVLKFETYCLD